MGMNSNNTIFPLDADFLKKCLSDWEIDLQHVSIRELNRLVDELSGHFKVAFLRFEFGVPGLNPYKIGPDEEIRTLQDNPRIPATYPPFDGIPRLKEAAAEFVKKFLDIDIPPKSCVPTVGAMHSGFICQAISGRKQPEADLILYLDPGFPVNKLQTKFLGLQEKSIDLFNYRGGLLIEKIEELFSTGRVGGLLWSSPNNPTWVCLKKTELEGIGKLLTEYDVIGIEDAAYLGMDYRQDYSVPGEPPFIPTIANYTDNYFLIISSSKIFSYAGQRVSVSISSESLMTREYNYLKKYFNSKTIRRAFIHGGIYPTTAGVPQTPQYALATFFETACKGEFDFLNNLKVYKNRAIKAKDIFLKNGFVLAYPDDGEMPLGDGFYFTIQREDLTSGELLYFMLQFGIAGIPLEITGSKRDGVRICISLVRRGQYEALNRRVQALDKYLGNLNK